MGVIIIIAVFWLLGLLTVWSMCVVAGTRRPAYGRAPPCRWSVQWQGFCESPCLISSACHVDCAEPYGRMAGRFRDMS